MGHRPNRAGGPRRSRRRWILLGTFLALVGLVAGWWFWWVPNWRPPLAADESYGIDVSAHQEEINWRSVAGDGIEFAYIKATEGRNFVDDRFEANWAAAQAAGIERGAYHFFTLCTPGVDQAENFLRVATPEEQALDPAVDLELAGNCSKRPPREVVHGELRRFLRLVEDAWQSEVVLYLGEDFESFYDVKQAFDRPLWLRRFLLRPSSPSWVIWQLHGYARVNGIEGGVDLDVTRPHESQTS